MMNGTLITKDGIQIVNLNPMDPVRDIYSMVGAKVFFTNTILIKDQNYRVMYDYYQEGFVSISDLKGKFVVHGNAMLLKCNLWGKFESCTIDDYNLIVNSSKKVTTRGLTLTDFKVDHDYEKKVAAYLAELKKEAKKSSNK